MRARLALIFMAAALWSCGEREIEEDAGVDAGADAARVDVATADLQRPDLLPPDKEPCPVGQKLCGKVCVDPTKDVKHCGACGTACKAGEVCSGGKCALYCQQGLSDCSGSCVNLKTDSSNCGTCGGACKAGELCKQGACALSCQAGLNACSGKCVNLKTDSSNCGACGTACKAGEACGAGVCALSCQAGLTACNGKCVDLKSDNANCGTCANACATGYACAAGKCALSCQKGLTNCSGKCVDTQTDLASCGTCGNACAAGYVCAAGKCALSCQKGLTACSGTCVDLSTSLSNCGKCGVKCGPGLFCVSGKCAPYCKAGATNCSGKCVDTQTDGGNCGACGNACASGKSCIKGKCGVAASCAKILASNPLAKSGVYTIQPIYGGSSFSAHCDMSTAGGGWTRVFSIKLGSGLGCTMTTAAKGNVSSASATCAKLSDAAINALGTSKIFFSRVGTASPLYTRYSGKIRVDGTPGKVVQSISYNDVASKTPTYTPQYGGWVFFLQQNWYHSDRCFGAQPSTYRLSLEYLAGKHICGSCNKYACSGKCNVDCPTSVSSGMAEVYIR